MFVRRARKSRPQKSKVQLVWNILNSALYKKIHLKLNKR